MYAVVAWIVAVVAALLIFFCLQTWFAPVGAMLLTLPLASLGGEALRRHLRNRQPA